MKKFLSLFLAAAILAAFLPALQNGFVWDDKPYLLENPHVAGGLTAENLRWALTAFEQGNWHPLTWASHMLDVEIFGLEPPGHHAISLLIHGANALLLFALLRGLTGTLWRSFLVAALFALHPLRVESVAWVAERKDVLSTFLGFLALGAYCRSVRQPGRSRQGAVLLLFALGLTAKPMVVTLPGVLLLLDYWPLGRLTSSSWRRRVLEKTPLFALATASGIVTLAAQADDGFFYDYPWGVRLGNAVVAYGRYLSKMVVPIDLAAFYPHPMTALPLRQTLGTLLLLATTTLLALLVRRRRPYLATGWLWYLGTLLPVLGLVQVGQQAMADRYTYVPLIGVFIVIAWAAGETAARRPGLGIPLSLGAAAALAALAATTFVQTGYWKDAVTLYTHAAAAAPGNWLAHFNLGAIYQDRGRTDEAIEQYRETLKYRVADAYALNNLGMIVAQRGDAATAVTYYQAAIRSAPGYADPYNNLGVELVNLGRAGEAETCYRAALGRDPQFLDARLNLAFLLLNGKNWAPAEAEFDAAVRLDPRSAKARKGLGVVLARRGSLEEAAAQFREAVRLDPGDRESRANLDKARLFLRR